MYCKNCGKELREGIAFCGNCGTPIGILKAVKRRGISEERINESLRRIIKAKLLWKASYALR